MVQPLLGLGGGEVAECGLDDVDVGGVAAVTSIGVGLEVAWCEVNCGRVVAKSAWVEVVLLTKSVSEVGGWEVWVCLLNVESEFVGSLSRGLGGSGVP